MTIHNVRISLLSLFLLLTVSTRATAESRCIELSKMIASESLGKTYANFPADQRSEIEKFHEKFQATILNISGEKKERLEFAYDRLLNGYIYQILQIIRNPELQVDNVMFLDLSRQTMKFYALDPALSRMLPENLKGASTRKIRKFISEAKLDFKKIAVKIKEEQAQVH